jgi:hypothetical protein
MNIAPASSVECANTAAISALMRVYSRGRRFTAFPIRLTLSVITDYLNNVLYHIET